MMHVGRSVLKYDSFAGCDSERRCTE